MRRASQSFKTEAELADSTPTLGCALYPRRERARYAVDTTRVLPRSLVFTAPSYNDEDGGVCEFRDLARGEYAGFSWSRTAAADRDLSMTYGAPEFDLVPERWCPCCRRLARWMASVAVAVRHAEPAADGAHRGLGCNTAPRRAARRLRSTSTSSRRAALRCAPASSSTRAAAISSCTSALRRLEVALPRARPGPGARHPVCRARHRRLVVAASSGREAPGFRGLRGLTSVGAAGSYCGSQGPAQNCSTVAVGRRNFVDLLRPSAACRSSRARRC